MTVAVLDGGVDPSAPGLRRVVTTGPSFGQVAGDTPAEGTVFASAVAGRGPSGSNPAGTVGLAPAARILSIKVPNRAGGGTWQRDIGAAIRYAASHGAQVIYVSEESFQDDAVLDSAVEYATARNAVVISPEFTFRNAPPSVSTVPDSLPGVLGAASVVLPGLPKPPHGMRYPANESILVAAPANALTVSGPLGQGYEMFDSLASAAWLTATVALIKSVYPHLPASLVNLAIARSARDHPRAGWSPQVGFGLINPDGALHQAAALAKVPVTAPAGPGSLAVSARFAPGRARGHRRRAPLHHQADAGRRRDGGCAAAARHRRGTGVALAKPSGLRQWPRGAPRPGIRHAPWPVGESVISAAEFTVRGYWEGVDAVRRLPHLMCLSSGRLRAGS